MNRYSQTGIAINQTAQYREVLEKKNLSLIRHYFTPKLRHPTAEEVASLTIIPHAWRVGDKYYKLAAQYYNDPKLWFVIAHFNQMPTEAHITINDTIQIPLPLDRVLQLFNF